MGDLRHQPLDVVTACRWADFAVLQLAEANLRQFLPFRKLYVITTSDAVTRFQAALPEAVIIDQDNYIPEMTLAKLKSLTLPGFPKGAGWYFQQLLKFAFCFRNTDDDYFLIWDADTIPLRPLEFFDESNRMLFATADERHAPYFETYRKLLGQEPNPEFSFISQHMIVQKSILREMLARIESNFPGDENWAWKIMKNLQGTHTNLFSEYEILGHYVKNNHPDRAAYRKLNWLREGAFKTKGVPSTADLERLSAQYDFVAFESGQMPLRRFVRQTRAWLQNAWRASGLRRRAS